MQPSRIQRLKRYMTMDNILLGIVLLLSSFWAAVFNSIDNPIHNQPINIVIDVKRNLLQFDSFLLYFVQFFAIYFCGYLLYWINHHLLVNRVLAKFGLFHYIWVAIIFTLVASPTLSQLALWLPINASEFTLLPSGNQDPFDEWNLRIAAIIMLFSLPVILAFKWREQEAELANLKQQNVQAELKWLQQQINPHFLFNTLNNLYSLTLSKSEKAPDCVLQLSNLLRFVVYQGGQDRVSLSDEINYLLDYIALQQIRVSHKSQIDIEIDPKLKNTIPLGIAPLMLVVILENAFKHGIDNSDKPSWLQVALDLEGNKLTLDCKNSIDTEAIGRLQDRQHGLGLDNLTRRLELVYKQKHTFTTKQKDTEFCALLSIELDTYEKP